MSAHDDEWAGRGNDVAAAGPRESSTTSPTMI
jgi:hypothetical protein